MVFHSKNNGYLNGSIDKTRTLQHSSGMGRFRMPKNSGVTVSSLWSITRELGVGVSGNRFIYGSRQEGFLLCEETKSKFTSTLLSFLEPEVDLHHTICISLYKNL